MADYYTNSEYSPVSPSRYQDQIVQPVQTVQNVAPVPQVPVGPVNYKYSTGKFHVDWKEIIKRGIKYLVEGLAVAFVAYYFIGRGRLNIKDIVMLGITAAFVFAILDTFSPTIALGTRFGAGFGIGQGLFGPAMVGLPGLGLPASTAVIAAV